MEMKNIDFGEKVVKNSLDSFRKWFEEEKIYLNKSITKNSKVLDIGCGDGRSLNEIIGISENLVGVDHEKKAIDDAIKNFKNNKIKFKLADARKLPFKDG